ncbi:MAG TPA: hypothetical protein DIU15_19330 [Deltaproteobacteria bacterium]|nr:hypothetical protein [Deltaproteobacteria bacterium]HCP48200.1 hypothetical protein [Deltaproteobacteria bacterium]
MSDSFVRDYAVRFGEIDHAGVMYYPKFFDRMHRAFEDFWAEALGRDYHQILDVEGIGFPLVDIHSSFKKPYRFGDTIRVTINVERMGSRSIAFRYRLGAPEEDGARAEATLIVSVIDMKTFTPRALPDDYRATLERYQLEAE